ncbi:Autophagy-related protein 9A [Holothuria leucospilota]|uniref:Autophagy-related protein 9 n=1 Tax=Holothuria leucospilota TaxID=206669 RepID=A0A9Q0YS15_HOLLE|nr:Autophagy-related protein 9A [Holothuria leucospilota]
MSRLETEYQRLDTHEDDGTDEQEVMLHMPDSGRARWNHIENLDAFFSRIYLFHQNHGYMCMMLSQILELVQFLFIFLFSLFLLRCVDYAKLFDHQEKISIPDVFKQCSTEHSPMLLTCLFVAGVFWFHRFVRVLYNAYQFWEIRAFYTSALKISSSELDNLTWHDVLKRVQQVQREQRMCIHKADLTELDIYHRILRFKNYMIAMVNKSLLPLKHNLPLLGEIVFVTNGLKYNLEMILFWGPCAPFKNYWELKEDYKPAAKSKREELAKRLSRTILWVGFANLILSPFIFVWQILYSFFSYAELIKREPSALGARKWSLYARLYLRHFNELDHEFQARLNRGYKPSTKYLNSFSSNIIALFAQNVAFFAGSVLAVLIILTVVDEDVLTVEHVLTTMTLLGVTVTVCRTLIPDENLIWCPEVLMQSILAQIHYIPDSWKGQAHTYKVRTQFSQLFQYKITHLIEELLSPIITPFVLIFQLRPRALDIVDFYRNFTVEVIGVGDVCSFAQMDVRNHGNPKWLTGQRSQANQYRQAEDGKTELSLMHFKMTNPQWQPPQESKMFIGALKEKAQQDVQLTNRVDAENVALVTSLQSLSSIDAGGFNSILGSLAIQQPHVPTNTSSPQPTAPSYLPLQAPVTSPVQSPEETQKKMKGSISTTEGPFHGEGSGILGSIQTSSPPGASPMTGLESVQLGAFASDSALLTGGLPRDFNTADMNFSALYMHRLHDNRIVLSDPEENEIQEDMPSGSWSTLPQAPLPVVPEQSLTDTSQSV